VNWIDGAGYLASALVLAMFCMKTMIPLRAAAICSNVAFIVHAFFDQLYPILILHVFLLPLNILRSMQMLRLIRRVETAAKSGLSLEWLRPFMKETRRSAGDILFKRGDYADRLFVTGGANSSGADRSRIECW